MQVVSDFDLGLQIQNLNGKLRPAMEITVTYHPHSLLDAVKLLADIAGMEWATAHRYYRDLQGGARSGHGDGWLPKSQGRKIWHAQPNFLSRFLVAIGMTDDPTMAGAVVSDVALFTPGGRKRIPIETVGNHVEQFLAAILRDPAAADAVERVEFDPVEKAVEVRYRDGSNNLFATPGSAEKTCVNGVIYRRGVIPGSVFAALSRTINWRVDSPFAEASEGQVGEEA